MTANQMGELARVINVDDLMSRCMGNLEFVDRILTIFQSRCEADLQELEPDGSAGGVRKGGFSKADAPHRTDQHIGHRGEPQSELIGTHGGGRGPVGVEVELERSDYGRPLVRT